MVDKMVLRELCKKGTGSTGEVVGKLLTYDVDTADDVDALVDSNYFGSTSGTRWNGINLITQKQCVSRGWFLVMPTNGRPVRYNKLSDVERFYDLGKGEVTIPVEGTMELLKNGTELVNNWIEYTGVDIDLSINNSSDKTVIWASSDTELFTVDGGTVTAANINNKIGKIDITANVDKTEFIANIVFNGITLDKVEGSNTVKLNDYTVIGGRINNKSIRYEWLSGGVNDPINTTDTYDVVGKYTVKAYLPFVSNDKKIAHEFVVVNSDITIDEPTEDTGDDTNS